VLLLVAQTQWRLGDIRAAQRVGEEAVAIAERGDDLILLADACNRLAAVLVLQDPPRTRQLYTKSLKIATALGDPFRRTRQLNNLGVLELLSNNWDEARRSLRAAADLARTAGLLESWGRAELNLGVLAGRIGDYDGAMLALSEALRITSLVQNSEEQLYATYNMAHIEREQGRFAQAIGTYELVTELAERIGQMEVQAGALAGMGLSLIAMADHDGARQIWHRAKPMIDRLFDWFQGRELVVGLELHIMLLDRNPTEAANLFSRALTMSGGSDDYGAAWLTAEFGAVLRLYVPDVIAEAVRQYASIPEVLGNPYIRDRFAVLKGDR
jgi:tetratricopeptide (TPR) repeat protein